MSVPGGGGNGGGVPSELGFPGIGVAAIVELFWLKKVQLSLNEDW